MRTILLVIGLLLATSLNSAAQTPSPDDQQRDLRVQSVIRAQIDAFLADDFTRAFDHASANIRAIFGTAERFAAMVVTGYPMVHRPADLRFVGQERRGGVLVQRVMITDQAGALHILEYDMIGTGDALRINGVRLLRAGQAGA